MSMLDKAERLTTATGPIATWAICSALVVTATSVVVGATATATQFNIIAIRNAASPNVVSGNNASQWKAVVPDPLPVVPDPLPDSPPAGHAVACLSFLYLDYTDGRRPSSS